MLSEKRIPFESVEIDLKNKPAWFLEISPYGKVPVLKHDQEILYESAVINEYLNEVFPEVPMMADTPAGRARFRIWIDFCNSRVQPAFVAVLRAEPAVWDEKVTAFEETLSVLEEYLEHMDMPAPFFAGQRFSLVDATYAPTFERFAVLSNLRGYELPIRFGRMRRWMANLTDRPSVAKTATPLNSLIANYISFLPVQVRRGA